LLPNHSIGRASAGDSSALATVVERLRPRLTKMAHYYARNTGEDTEDLLQEAYVGLLEAVRKIDLGIGDAEQFLLKHARWRLLDAARRWGRRRCDSLGAEHDHLPPTRDWDAELAEISVDDFAGQLKPVQREVLLRLLLGMTWREAGERLGCSSANVAYHVRQIQRAYTAGPPSRWTVTRTMRS
jgi:RNA polymerase sigma factor (sigma-70 family)